MLDGIPPKRNFEEHFLLVITLPAAYPTVWSHLARFLVKSDNAECF